MMHDIHTYIYIIAPACGLTLWPCGPLHKWIENWTFRISKCFCPFVQHFPAIDFWPDAIYKLYNYGDYIHITYNIIYMYSVHGVGVKKHIPWWGINQSPLFLPQLLAIILDAVWRHVPTPGTSEIIWKHHEGLRFRKARKHQSIFSNGF